MRILVIGGLGFIGYNLTRHLAQHYKNIAVLDKIMDISNLPNMELELYRIDVSNREDLERAFRSFIPDMVISVYGETHVIKTVIDSLPFITSNCMVFMNIVDMCIRMMIPLIHFSTDEVFGNVARGGDIPDEDSTLPPSNPYSITKAYQELYLQHIGERTGYRSYVIFRPCNVFGSYHHSEKLIPMIVLRLIREKKATIYGTEKQIRMLIDVDSLGRLVMHIIELLHRGETVQTRLNIKQR